MQINNSSFDMSDFEDPINMEPLTNIVRCPHEPCHYYQAGTLKKKIENKIEYTQCPLANQWFTSNQFIPERLATSAIKTVYQLNQENFQIKQDKDDLKNKVNILTEEINKIKKKHEEDNQNHIKMIIEKDELHDKTILEFKNFLTLQETEHQKQIDRYQQIIIEHEKLGEEQKSEKIKQEKKYLEILEKFQLQEEKQNKINMEQEKKIAMILKKDGGILNNTKNHLVLKIAIAIVSIGTIIWSSHKIFPKLKGLFV